MDFGINMDAQFSIRSRPITLSQKVGFVLLIQIIFFSIFRLSEFWLKDKCSIVDCETADWATVQEIIASSPRSWDKEYYLHKVSVFPRINDLGEIGLATYVVDYISMKPENSQTPAQYQELQAVFDNQNLWVENQSLGYTTKTPPTIKNIANLNEVIAPEDAIRLTLILARTALGEQPVKVNLSLIFSDNESSTHTWRVVYFGANSEQIHYWLDALNGKIIETNQ